MSNSPPAKSSRLLIDENPLQVLPSLATAIGLNESIILQQVQYWLTGSRVHERDGHLWIYNSIPQWKENFPWWSESTIKRALNNLRESGLLIVDNFNAAAFDKTLWYRIDYEALAKLENIKRVNRRSGQNDPTSGAGRPDEKFILNRPIPETTKPEITSETTNTNSAREDVEPNLTPPRARENFSQNSLSENQSNGQAVRLGSLTPSPILDISVLEEEDETAQSEDLDDEPDDSANDDLTSLSAAPSPPGLSVAQALAYAMLTDSEVGIGEQDALTWVRDKKRKPLDLIRHVAVWWRDHYLRKTADGVGALTWRIQNDKSPNRLPDAVLESEFYRRHYPLTQQQQEVRQRTLDYTGKAPPHPLGALADQLPAPVWEAS